eukprot:6670220-Pyramimonas_sp.AAC.1
MKSVGHAGAQSQHRFCRRTRANWCSKTRAMKNGRHRLSASQTRKTSTSVYGPFPGLAYLPQ